MMKNVSRLIEPRQSIPLFVNQCALAEAYVQGLDGPGPERLSRS